MCIAFNVIEIQFSQKVVKVMYWIILLFLVSSDIGRNIKYPM